MVRKLTGELGGLVSGLSPAVSSLHDLRKASAYIFKHNIKLRLWSSNWDPNTLFLSRPYLLSNKVRLQKKSMISSWGECAESSSKAPAAGCTWGSQVGHRSSALSKPELFHLSHALGLTNYSISCAFISRGMTSSTKGSQGYDFSFGFLSDEGGHIPTPNILALMLLQQVQI